jgi:pyruvate kinase
MARTKIIATLGPASSQPCVLQALIDAGVNVVRLNFSHADHSTHRRAAEAVRREAERAGRSVSLLGDLRGPKIRMGDIPGGSVTLEKGQSVALSTAKNPESHELPIDFPSLHTAVKSGESLLLDDGKIVLEVSGVADHSIGANVVIGGALRSQKGINLPETDLGLSALTEKDRDDVIFGVRELGLDLFALSFVQRSGDVDELRAVLTELGATTPIIAKIEKRRALEDFTAILEASDGVMVARGDLGVEIPYEHVPGIQKNIIREANLRAKPVITATEMLESMITSWRPTRAEATDVANAILDGTDAVMLSAETAVGHDPAKAVDVLKRIADVTEREMGEGPRHPMPPGAPDQVPLAICQAAVQIARDLGADALLCLTMSGTTARRLAKHRPKGPIFAISPRLETARALNLSWGVVPLHLPDLVPPQPQESFNVDTAFDQALTHLGGAGHLASGRRAVCVAGIPFNVEGMTNLVAVREVP